MLGLIYHNMKNARRLIRPQLMYDKSACTCSSVCCVVWGCEVRWWSPATVATHGEGGALPPIGGRRPASRAARCPPPPKEAHSRIFVSGGQYSRDKCAAKKI